MESLVGGSSAQGFRCDAIEVHLNAIRELERCITNMEAEIKERKLKISKRIAHHIQYQGQKQARFMGKDNDSSESESESEQSSAFSAASTISRVASLFDQKCLK
jgi:hypothetical protein